MTKRGARKDPARGMVRVHHEAASLRTPERWWVFVREEDHRIQVAAREDSPGMAQIRAKAIRAAIRYAVQRDRGPGGKGRGR